MSKIENYSFVENEKRDETCPKTFNSDQNQKLKSFTKMKKIKNFKLQ